MDKRKSLLNVSVAIIFKIIILVLQIVSRRFLIEYVGNDANGINSLYTSLIGVLAIADLGIGVAITYCMYDPITKGDNAKVAGLYKLFSNVYKIIGIIILVLGLLLLPALPYLANDFAITPELFYNFVIFLLATVVTYFFSAKLALINAYKNNYISTAINSIGEVVRMLFEIAVLVIFKSFTLYIAARLLSSIIQWILTEIVTKKKYNTILILDSKVDSDTKKSVVRNVKAMFAHKIGGLFVSTADSLIISAFISVGILGKYSNYTTIVMAMNSVIILFFTPLTSIIGHLCVKDDKKEIKNYFMLFYLFNFIIGIVFYLGYFAIIDDLVLLCFGTDLELDWTISFVITINYFILFLRQTMNTFRDATGVFYYDRFKPLIEAGFNLILSLILVQFMGVFGVILASIITFTCISNVIEPHVLFKYAFDSKPKKYYFLNYFLIIVFVLSLLLLKYLMVDLSNPYLNILANGFIAVGIASVPCIIIVIVFKNFRTKVISIIKNIVLKLKKTNSKNIPQ